jgi:hypothetical protein
MRPTIDPTPSAPPPPGGLGIRQRRSWQTWQVVVAATVAWVLGMMVGYSGQKPSAESGTGKPIVSLGALAANTPTTGAGAAPTAATTATTAAPETTVTTAAAPPVGAPTVLMPNTPGSGPSDLPAFTAGGPWSIGWHFRCVNTPAGTGTFSLEVIPDAGAPGAPAAPAIQQTSREGQGVTPQTAPGRQHVKVTTDPACQWAVKVTGIAP